MNLSKAELQGGVRSGERSAAAGLWFGLLVAAGLLLRLLFMGNEGFKNDVASFEAWAMTLASHPFSQFYASTSFADYPPGYFYVLWLVGHVYAVLSPHGNLDLLKYLVKLPAVVMDLVDGALIYAIVRRFAGERWALGAAALFLLNPAMIFISAAWGQVDSISSGFALFGVYLLLLSNDRDERACVLPIVLAWVALSYSLLIKPQAAVLIPLFLAFAFVNRERCSALRRNWVRSARRATIKACSAIGNSAARTDSPSKFATTCSVFGAASMRPARSPATTSPVANGRSRSCGRSRNTHPRPAIASRRPMRKPFERRSRTKNGHVR